MDPVLARELLDKVSDGVYFLDADRRITYWSRGAERITGFAAEEVLGQRCADNILVHTDCEGRVLCGHDTCPAMAAMRTATRRTEQIVVKHRNGHRVPVRTQVRPVRDVDGTIVGVAEIFAVTTAAMVSEAKLRELEELALLDPLTGVGNRRFGEKELSDRLDEEERYGWNCGVLFIDIDRFKQINDIHGHHMGDRVLTMVAQTLSHNVRSFDSVTRWGGEEFLLLLKNIDAKDLEATAEKLRALIASGRLTHELFRLEVTVSIGATMVQPGDTPESVVRRADTLMYESKQGGGDRVTIRTTTRSSGSFAVASCRMEATEVDWTMPAVPAGSRSNFPDDRPTE